MPIRRKKQVKRRFLGAGSRRRGLLIVVLLAVLIAAVGVTGTVMAVSRPDESQPLASPLSVFPVTSVTPGQCAAGTRGVNATTATGPACYQVANGIVIREVAGMAVQPRGGQYDVAIDLLPTDRRSFGALTRSALGREVAFVMRDRLITAPRVDMPITGGRVLLTGSFSRADADRLVRELTGG